MKPNLCEHRSIDRMRIVNGLGDTVSLSWRCDECNTGFQPIPLIVEASEMSNCYCDMDAATPDRECPIHGESRSCRCAALEAERDEALAAMNADVADVVLDAAALRAALLVAEAERDAVIADSHALSINLHERIAALRAAQGEVGEMVRFHGYEAGDEVTVKLPHGHPLRFANVKVRVSKVEPGQSVEGT
jgi:hypothetical protein